MKIMTYSRELGEKLSGFEMQTWPLLESKFPGHVGALCIDQSDSLIALTYEYQIFLVNVRVLAIADEM